MTSGLADLEARLASVERRLAALEGTEPSETDYDGESVGLKSGDGFAAYASTHVGRVLLIFGGAYLLRTLTESQFVPTSVGLVMGAVYAVFWLFWAYRSGGDESQRTYAAFFGGTSVVLALPLLHEATTRFTLISGVEGIVALSVYSALALLVAVLRDLKTLGWLVVGGGIVAGIASLLASHAAVAVAIYLLLLGLGSLWVVYWREWLGLPWLGAIGANFGVLAVVGLANTEQWSIQPRVPFLLAVSLLASYLVSFTFQTHVRGKLVSFFEAVQVPIAAAIVLGAAIIAVQGGNLEIATAGVMGVILGCGGYALAITKETRNLRYRNFFYYSTFGLVFLLVGTGLLIPLVWAAVIWALWAVVMAWFSGRKGWVSLSLQCTFLLLAAGAASGMLMTGLEALVGDPSDGWITLLPASIVVTLATVTCLFIPVAQRSERWGVLAGLPQLLVLALSVWEVGGIIIASGGQLLADANGPVPNLAILAALRTAVLSTSATMLAISSRYHRWPEARWLVYPVLVLVGIKLFVEDFPNGQPASLFVALVFVGSALLLAAPLLKNDKA